MTIRHLIIQAACAVAFASNLLASTASIELVSRPHESGPASFGDSSDVALSADGQWAVFTSTGNGIVTNDHNGFFLDVFLRNLATGETTLLSGNNKTNDALANGHSYGGTISADGRLVLFESEADNLVAGDDNEASDVFLYDRTAGELSVIGSRSGGFFAGSSGAGIMTADARFIVFETAANGVVALDTNNSVDLYRMELATGQLDLVSARSNSLAPAGVAFTFDFTGNYEASVSADGRFIAFVSSGTNHYPGVPGNAAPQIYLRDMTAQTNAWLTRSTNGSGATIVGGPVVSADGASVVFLSSSILPTSTLPGISDTFLYRYDIPTGQLRRLPGFAAVEEFALSDNGQFIAVASSNQVFLHDVAAGTNRLASTSATGVRATGVSADVAISGDGRYVVFISSATNLVGGSTNEYFQTYRFDSQSGEVALLSRSAAAGGDTGAEADTHFPVISRDGSTVGFMSYASNLVPEDNLFGNDVFVVSSSGTGAVALASAPHPQSISATAGASSYLEGESLSADGRFVIFSSEAANIVPNDTNSARDIFIRDLQTGTTKLISTQPDGSSFPLSVSLIRASTDGNIIAFLGKGNVAGTNRGVYIYNRTTGATKLASILPTESPALTLAEVMLSPDGRFLFFREINSTTHFFVRDLETETTVRYAPPAGSGLLPVTFSPNGRFLITRNTSTSYALHEWQSNRFITNILTDTFISNSITADSATLLVNLRGATFNTPLLTLYSLDGSRTNVTIATNATALAISADGSTVAYQVRPSALSNIYNVRFYDVKSGTSTALSLFDSRNIPVDVRPRGAASLSANGRYFAFAATNSFDSAAGANTFNDIYIYDRVLKTIRPVSRNDAGIEGEFGSSNPSISANGRVVAFDSFAPNLVAGDLNLSSDVFVGRLAPVDSDADGLEDGWETDYFLALNSTGDADSDGDGVSNLDEFRAGTDPKSAASKFSIESDIEPGADSFTLTSAASPGSVYQLQYRASLSAGEWQDRGPAAAAYSETITFEAPLNLQANGFFRIKALD